MQIIKNKEKIGNILFSVGFFIELMIMIVGHSVIEIPFRGRLTHVAFALFCCKILTTRYSKKQWIGMVLAGILGAFCYLMLREEYVIRFVVMAFAAKDIDTDKYFRKWFLVSLAGTVIIAMLAITGVAGLLVDVRHYGRGVEEARWCFGFNHANNVHCMFWYLAALFLFINRKQNTLKVYGVCFFLNLVLYAFTKSRTGFIATMLLVVGMVAFQYIKSLNKKWWVYLAGAFSVGLCIFLTIWGCIYGYTKSELVRFADLFLTQRLQMGYVNANFNEWQLLPTPREYGGVVDNGITMLFYEYGVLCATCMLIMLFWLIYIMYKQHNGCGFIILLTTVLVFFMEKGFIFNASLLYNVLIMTLMSQWEKGQSRSNTGELI